MNCIQTENLSFRFTAHEQVLNNISMQVPQGSIFGFIGPNGAGKTTTLKLILGLLKKQQGSIKIFDKPFEHDRIEILKNVGSLIEAPSFYAHLTATQNLSLLQKVYQCPKSRIKDVLEIVDLAHTGKKKVGKFSFGMKQRLSIAIALLHNPSLLILDEPTNGLDPNGIMEIRELLKKLNTEQNTTILISSHLLSEIEKLVTHVCIINKGVILFQDTLDALQKKQKLTSSIRFETGNSAMTAEIFTQNNQHPVLNNGHVEIPNAGREEIAKLNQLLVNSGIDVYQITTVRNDLETIFMDLTKSES
ncbi:MAG: ABC transporter ATP-binding protein [Bacteroidota bacterium]